MSPSVEHNELTLDVIARLLRVTPAQVRLELDVLPTALAEYHPARGEWCVKEILGHLIEEDPLDFAGRVRAILAEEDTLVKGSDQEALARQRQDCHRDLQELLEEFSRQRTESLVLITSLTSDDLARAGRHPRIGRITVSDLLHDGSTTPATTCPLPRHGLQAHRDGI